MLNDNKNIKDMSEQKDINKIDFLGKLPTYNSILNDEEKTLNLVTEAIAERRAKGNNYKVPKSFDDIPQSTFIKMNMIDQIQQKGFISRDMAIDLFADLFENDSMRQRFEEYTNDLFEQKLRQLYETLEIEYQDLLNALNTGSITEKEFMEKYSKLREIESNSMQEITRSDEILHSHSRK